MKIPQNPINSKGFTLVELLVVIAIIAVLAATGLAGGLAAMERARKVSSQAGAVSISNAIEQFYADNSTLPDPAASTQDTQFDTVNDQNGLTLLEILFAIEDGEDESLQNPRRIRYLTAKEGNNSKDGIIFNQTGDQVEGMFDSWGRPFYIWMDYDYDERLDFSPSVDGAPTLRQATLNGKRVAVFSLGVGEPGDAKEGTLVKTW